MTEIIPYGPSPSQFFRLRAPETGAPCPVLIIVHGGYWKQSHSLDSYATRELESWAAENLPECAIVNVEYRRLPASDAHTEDSAGNWRDMVDDVRQALNRLAAIATDRALDLSRSCLVGHSAGGYLSAMAVSEALTRVTAAFIPTHTVLMSAILSTQTESSCFKSFAVSQPQQMTALLDGDEPALADPLQQAPRCSRLYLVHGTADDTVPIAHSEAYASAWQEQIMRFEKLTDAGHFGMFAMQGQTGFEHHRHHRPLVETLIRAALQP